MNMRRRPRMSPARPPSSSSPPNVSVYPFITQDRLVDEKCRPFWMCGRAMFTTVASRMIMSCAPSMMVSARFLRPCLRLGAAVAATDMLVLTWLSPMYDEERFGGPLRLLYGDSLRLANWISEDDEHCEGRIRGRRRRRAERGQPGRLLGRAGLEDARGRAPQPHQAARGRHRRVRRARRRRAARRHRPPGRGRHRHPLPALPDQDRPAGRRLPKPGADRLRGGRRAHRHRTARGGVLRLGAGDGGLPRHQARAVAGADRGGRQGLRAHLRLLGGDAGVDRPAARARAAGRACSARTSPRTTCSG